MHDLRGVLYVGRADDLRRRFEDHLAASHNADVRRALSTTIGLLCFSWVLVAAPEQIELERSLIRSLRPLCNIQHNSSNEECASKRKE
jgi:excinuclease UvrABC nuclease subunit